MSDGGETFGPELLQIEARYEGTKVTLILVGEFDMTGTELFSSHVREAIGTHPGSIVVNGRRLEFVDSGGLQALIRAREAAGDAGVTFRVDDPSPELQRIIELTGLRDLLLDE
jgi:anti-sigma B factor antagonist